MTPVKVLAERAVVAVGLVSGLAVLAALLFAVLSTTAFR